MLNRTRSLLIFFKVVSSSEQGAIRIDFFHRAVGNHDQNEAKYRLVQPDGCGHSKLLCGHQRAEHKGINHIRGVKQETVITHQLIEHGKIAPEDSTN